MLACVGTYRSVRENKVRNVLPSTRQKDDGPTGPRRVHTHATGPPSGGQINDNYPATPLGPTPPSLRNEAPLQDIHEGVAVAEEGVDVERLR